MKALLDIFAVRHEINRKVRLKNAENFLSDFRKMQREVAVRREPKLNVFELLDFGNDEVALSALLAWLFDERKSHCHGSLFLETFVKLCKLNLPVEILVDYHVWTEHGEEEAVIDIMVYRQKEFLLYIENKIFAPEGENQTTREFQDMKRVGSAYGIPQDRQFAIFMSPEGRQPNDSVNGWNALSLNTLSDAFLGLGERIRSQKVRYLLEDLHETTTKWRQS